VQNRTPATLAGVFVSKFAEFSRKSAESRQFRLPWALFSGISRAQSGHANRPGSRPEKGSSMANKNDLIAAVAERTGMSKAAAAEAVDATFDVITAALKSGDEVKIIGFGNFSVAARAASEGRNPRTGETIQIAASKTPKFKAGKGLKDAVN
jgi:DNA-binding protein HU-beta